MSVPAPPPPLQSLTGFHGVNSGQLYVGLIVDVAEPGTWCAEALVRPLWRIDADTEPIDLSSNRWTQWVDVDHLVPITDIPEASHLAGMVMSRPPVWRDIDPDSALADVMPTHGQHVWLDNGVSYILGRYRTDLVGREIGPGVPARPWCDRFGNSLPHVPLAWRALDAPPPHHPDLERAP